MLFRSDRRAHTRFVLAPGPPSPGRVHQSRSHPPEQSTNKGRFVYTRRLIIISLRLPSSFLRAASSSAARSDLERALPRRTPLDLLLELNGWTSMSARCSIFVCCTDNRLALSDLNDACLEIVCDAAKRAQRSALSGGNGNQRSHHDKKDQRTSPSCSCEVSSSADRCFGTCHRNSRTPPDRTSAWGPMSRRFSEADRQIGRAHV